MKSLSIVVVVTCDGFETDLGWEYDKEWERGAPQGLAGDPDSAFSGQSVTGEDLTGLGNDPGEYESSERLLSPVRDASAASNLELSFRRYLGALIFRGLDSAEGEADCAVGGVTLDWEPPAAWGTGGGGT